MKAITPLNEFTVIRYDTGESSLARIEHPTLDNLAAVVVDYVEALKVQRSPLEATWEECWRQYLSYNAFERVIPLHDRVLNANLESVNCVDKESQRNNVSAAQVVEKVETAVSHLKNALFPNGEWFNVKARDPQEAEAAEILSWYLRNKHDDWQFLQYAELHLRQLVLLGVSCLALPWVNDGIEYRVLDMFDVFFDLTSADYNKAPIVRKQQLTVAEAVTSLETGYFGNISVDVLRNGYGETHLAQTSYAQQSVSLMKGVQQFNTDVLDNKVNVFEYWGDLHVPGYGTVKDAVITVIGTTLVRMQINTYPCRPFIINTYTPVLRNQAGVGVAQQMLGISHAVNKALNQALDASDLSNRGIYTLRADEVLNDSDLQFRAGDVIRLNDPNNLQPLPMPRVDMNASATAIQLLSDFAARVTGVSNLMSAGSVRNAERVTAEEVINAREAGGTRLLTVHTHLVSTFIIPLILAETKLVRRYTNYKTVDLVHVKQKSGMYWVKLHDKAFDFDTWIDVRAADHTVTASRKLTQIVEFLNLVMPLPQLAEMLDLPAVLKEVMMLMELPESFVRPQTEPPVTSNPMSAEPVNDNVLEQDASMQAMLQANDIADGGASLAANTFGLDQQQIMEMLNGQGSIGASVQPDPATSGTIV